MMIALSLLSEVIPCVDANPAVCPLPMLTPLFCKRSLAVAAAPGSRCNMLGSCWPSSLANRSKRLLPGWSVTEPLFGVSVAVMSRTG
jgi:hypothetical protein